MLAEGGKVRGIDLDPLAADEVRQVVFFVELLETAIGRRRIRRALYGQLLVRRQARRRASRDASFLRAVQRPAPPHRGLRPENTQQVGKVGAQQ